MRVCHLIAPVRFGGGESLLLNLIGEKSADLQESVACLFSSDIFEFELERKNIAYFKLQKRQLRQNESRLKLIILSFLSLRLIFKLRKIIKDNDIDILHVHGFPSSIVAFFTYFIVRKPMVYTHHSKRRLAGRLERLILEPTYSHFKFLTSVSCSATKAFALSFPKLRNKAVCVYDCIGRSFFNTKLVKKKNPKKVFVQVGRLVPLKNHELVIRSIAVMSAQDRANFEVIFVGDGPERNNLNEYIKKEKLEGTIRFAGSLGEKDLINTLSNADFGLFPSIDVEGFGIAVAEYMSQGLPVLSLDTDLMFEIVGKAGIQVSAEYFNQGINQLLQMDEESLNEMRQLARKRSLDFHPEKIKFQYVDIYKRAMVG